MFLADDELAEFYTKNNEIIIKSSRNDTIVPQKRSVCRFFVPAISNSSKKTKDANTDAFLECNHDDADSGITNTSSSVCHSSLTETLVTNSDTPLVNNLSLISNPLPIKVNSINLIKSEKFPSSFDSSSSPLDSFSSLPSLTANTIVKSVSDICDTFALNGQSSESVEQFSNFHTTDNNQINRSLSLFLSNSSAIKSEPIVSCASQISSERPSCPSPPSSFNTLFVDLDGEIPQKHKVTQPTTVIDRLRKRKNSLRNYLVSVKSSSSSNRGSRSSVISNSDVFDEVRRTVTRVIETDEETEPAVDEKKRKVSSLSSDNSSTKYSHDYIPTENELLSNELIPDRILNVNIDCPFIEYLTDASHHKYIDHSKTVQQCACKQNELDHIQQSLPDRFQLRESDVFEIGVWSKSVIISGTIIGPYLGEIVEYCKAEQNRYKTRGTSKSDYFSPCIEFAFKSNWLRCVNFTNDPNKSNLKIVHLDNKVFFQTTKIIEPNEELLVANQLQSVGTIDMEALKNIADGYHLILPTDVDYTILSDEDIENIPYNGTKYSKEMIVDIAKLWRTHPQMTVCQTLNIISKKHPSAKEISERYLSRITRKYRLRHKGGANVKFDSQMREFVRMLLLKYPQMPASLINKKLLERFPLRVPLDNGSLSRIILEQRLRPSRESCKLMNEMMMQDTVTKDVDNNNNNNNNQDQPTIDITIPKAQSPIIHAPTSRSHTSNKSISSSLSISTQSPTQNQFIRNEDDIINSIKQILQLDPFKHIDQVMRDVRRRFPADKCIDLQTVRTLMKKNNLQINNRFVKKIDDDMKRKICQLRLENPDFSAATINRYLRKLLPDKPCVEQNAIYLVLRKFNLTENQ